MSYRVHLLAALAAAALAVGCSRQDPGAAGAAWQKRVVAAGGYAFEHPAAWSVEAVPDANGMLVMCPTIEAHWQANVFFEIRSNRNDRPVARMLAEYVPSLNLEKPGFRLLASCETNLPSGLTSGSIEYTHLFDATELTDAETIIVLDNHRLLFVLTSTASSVKGKYQPILRRIVNSIAKP